MADLRYYSYDGARVSGESALGKELATWEQPNYRPSEHPFPKMLYRAQHRPDGRRSVGEVLDSVCGGAEGSAQQWSRQCQLTVNDESEMVRAFESGWRKTPQEALDYLEAQDNSKSNLTAERHASDARMSELAQREAAAVDHSTLKQIPSVPEAPLPRKGRKVQVGAGPEA